MDFNRRTFIKNSALATAGAGLTLGMPLIAGCAPKDPIRFGVIGLNGVGFYNLTNFLDQPDTVLVALCDVDSNVLEKRAAEAVKYHKKVQEKRGVTDPPELKPDLYSDYRKLLERKDIDAVIIAVPDHWHCLMMVEACQAGKDIYMEKPLGNTIGESILMGKAAQRYNRVIQVGQVRRSDTHWVDAIHYVQSGALGNVRTVKAWAYLSWLKPAVLPQQPVPEGVDYDFWLGPAPKREFNPNRFHFNFRWWWDYAGGLMSDWGVHLIDMATYGMQAGMPKSVMAVGDNYSIDPKAMETPDTQTVIYEFDDFTLLWEHAIGIDLGPYKRSNGVAFIGDNGTLLVDGNGWEVTPEKAGIAAGMEARPLIKGDGKGMFNHVRNFLDCIRSRKTPNASVEIAKNVAVVSHMGNIAHRTRQRVAWDHEKMNFIGQPDASALIWPEYRAPWKLPNL